MKSILLIVGWLWALPTSLLGFALAFFGLARFYAIRPCAVLYFVAEFGPWAWFFARFKMAATTMGAVTVCTSEAKDNPENIRHERQHTYQALWFGPLFIPIYYLSSLVAWMRGGSFYWDNWMEKQAYAVQGDVNS